MPGAEHGHHRIADMFLDRPAMRLDHSIQPCPKGNHLITHIFRVQFSGISGVAGKVGKEHRHLFAFASGNSGGLLVLRRVRAQGQLSASRAKSGIGRQVRCAMRTARR